MQQDGSQLEGRTQFPKPASPSVRWWECRCGKRLAMIYGAGNVCREGCTVVLRCRYCGADNSLEEAK